MLARVALWYADHRYCLCRFGAVGERVCGWLHVRAAEAWERRQAAGE